MSGIPLALQIPQTRIRIRAVQLGDAQALRDSCWPNRPFMSIYQMIARARQMLAEKYGMGVVALGPNGEIAGYGQMTNWPVCAEISDVMVTEGMRGQGVGTAVIQTLARAARTMGATEVEIGAALSNPRAADLYRRLGFSDSHTAWIHLDEDKEQVLFLRLSLRSVQPERAHRD